MRFVGLRALSASLATHPPCSLQLVIKSGKFTLGYKTVLKCLRSGKGARSQSSAAQPSHGVRVLHALGRPAARRSSGRFRLQPSW